MGQFEKNPPADREPTLSPQDQLAFDAALEQRRAASQLKLQTLIEQSASTPSTDVPDPARVQRIQGWMNLLDLSTVPTPPADLAQRTLEAIRADRMRIPEKNETPAAPPAERSSWRSGFRMRDIAAMLIAGVILVTVLIPAVGQARKSALRSQCVANLGAVGRGFALYAKDFSGQLPSLEIPADRNWRNSPLADARTARSNSAHLLPMINAKYVEAKSFLCPARQIPASATIVNASFDLDDQARGFSYVNMLAPVTPAWDGRASNIILADRNPLFAPNGSTDPRDNSPNHGGAGTNILHADGSISFDRTPDAGPGRDNIWTISNAGQLITTYAGTEEPTTPGDVFLSP